MSAGMRVAGGKTLKSNRRVARFRRILLDHLAELRKRYKVASLGLFGSYVRQAHRKRSDLDVLVEFTEAPTLFEFVELEQRLSDLLGVRVDLVMRSALKPHIGRRILSEVVNL